MTEDQIQQFELIQQQIAELKESNDQLRTQNNVLEKQLKDGKAFGKATVYESAAEKVSDYWGTGITPSGEEVSLTLYHTTTRTGKKAFNITIRPHNPDEYNSNTPGYTTSKREVTSRRGTKIDPMTKKGRTKKSAE